MQNVKTARFDPMPDRPQPKASGKQLLSRDNAVLAARERLELSFTLDECPTSLHFRTCR